MRSGGRKQARIGRDVAAIVQADDVDGLRRIELVDLALVDFCERLPLFVMHEKAVPKPINLFERIALA
jgi:hypothetical protein